MWTILIFRFVHFSALAKHAKSFALRAMTFKANRFSIAIRFATMIAGTF